MRECNKCSQEKAISEFEKNRHTCKECRKVYHKMNREKTKEQRRVKNKEWRDNNREYILKKNKEYRDKNPDRCKDWALKSFKRHYAKHREELLVKNKEYRRENRDRECQRKREWRGKNRDRVKKYRAAYNRENKEKTVIWSAKRRALKANLIGFNLPTEVYTEHLLAVQDETCPSCDADLRAGRCDLDHHYPLSSGGLHDISNVVFLCSACNLAKWNKAPSMFYDKEQLARIEELISAAVSSWMEKA